MEKTRRRLLQGMAATGFVAGTSTWGDARAQGMQPDLILRNGQFTTLDRSNPQADAVAIKDGRFIAVGLERDVMVLAGSGSKVIDLKGRRAVPGLIDSHMHIIRGGLNYNMELRWDGVRSLGDAMADAERAGRTHACCRNGSASSAASRHNSLPRSGCRRSTRSMRSRQIRRCSCCISTTARC